MSTPTSDKFQTDEPLEKWKDTLQSMQRFLAEVEKRGELVRHIRQHNRSQPDSQRLLWSEGLEVLTLHHAAIIQPFLEVMYPDNRWSPQTLNKLREGFERSNEQLSKYQTTQQLIDGFRESREPEVTVPANWTWDERYDGTKEEIESLGAVFPRHDENHLPNELAYNAVMKMTTQELNTRAGTRDIALLVWVMSTEYLYGSIAEYKGSWHEASVRYLRNLERARSGDTQVHDGRHDNIRRLESELDGESTATLKLMKTGWELRETYVRRLKPRRYQRVSGSRGSAELYSRLRSLRATTVQMLDQNKLGLAARFALLSFVGHPLGRLGLTQQAAAFLSGAGIGAELFAFQQTTIMAAWQSEVQATDTQDIHVPSFKREGTLPIHITAFCDFLSKWPEKHRVPSESQIRQYADEWLTQVPLETWKTDHAQMILKLQRDGVLKATDVTPGYDRLVRQLRASSQTASGTPSQSLASTAEKARSKKKKRPKRRKQQGSAANLTKDPVVTIKSLEDDARPEPDIPEDTQREDSEAVRKSEECEISLGIKMPIQAEVEDIETGTGSEDVGPPGLGLPEPSQSGNTEDTKQLSETEANLQRGLPASSEMEYDGTEKIPSKSSVVFGSEPSEKTDVEIPVGTASTVMALPCADFDSGVPEIPSGAEKGPAAISSHGGLLNPTDASLAAHSVADSTGKTDEEEEVFCTPATHFDDLPRDIEDNFATPTTNPPDSPPGIPDVLELPEPGLSLMEKEEGYEQNSSTECDMRPEIHQPFPAFMLRNPTETPEVIPDDSDTSGIQSDQKLECESVRDSDDPKHSNLAGSLDVTAAQGEISMFKPDKVSDGEHENEQEIARLGEKRAPTGLVRRWSGTVPVAPTPLVRQRSAVDSWYVKKYLGTEDDEWSPDPHGLEVTAINLSQAEGWDTLTAWIPSESSVEVSYGEDHGPSFAQPNGEIRELHDSRGSSRPLAARSLRRAASFDTLPTQSSTLAGGAGVSARGMFRRSLIFPVTQGSEESHSKPFTRYVDINPQTPLRR